MRAVTLGRGKMWRGSGGGMLWEDTWKESAVCVMEKFGYCVSNNCCEGA